MTESFLVNHDILEHPIYTISSNIEKPMDFLKLYMLKVHFWVSLAAIFVLTSYRQDIFCFGYICFAFIFFSHGTDLFTKPLKKIIKWWKILMAYNLLTLSFKISVDVLGCRFDIKLFNQICSFATLLHIKCYEDTLSSYLCTMNQEDFSYVYDVIFFVIILVQRRILLSYYFYNFIYETYTNSLLASR
jgi:hypothetical protein